MERSSKNPGVVADAERWHARLRAADCTASERMEFQRWRAVHEHAAAYAATERLWQSLGRLAGRADLQRLSEQVLADTGEKAHSRGLRYGVAASLLIAVLGAFLILQDHAAPALVYATQPGERSTITLPDGSQLVLNSATEIDVQLGRSARRLVLRKGEALFSVAQDETRPFKVTAGDGEVTALGTRFQVRNESQRVTVTLLEGRVALERKDIQEHTQLAPGDQVRFTVAAPQMTRRLVDPDLAASWATGRLRFRSAPLSEVLDEVNRYSASQIRIADPELSHVPISGTFKMGDDASVVSALEALLPITAARQSDGDVLLRSR